MSNQMPAWPEHPFWDWSLEVYPRPGVAPALLWLQDEHDLDVNLILFCIWAAVGTGGLSREEVAAARSALAGWRHQLLKPLRALRRACGPDHHGLPGPQLLRVREALKRAELEAEHAAQLCIAASLRRSPAATLVADPLAAAAAGLRDLLALESTDTDPPVLAALAVVLSGCLAGVDTAAATLALRADG